MRSAWGARLAADRGAVPVEMRFIDLFMAALGALIFMAMMLAFLLRFVPAHDARRPAPASPTVSAPPEPLRIVTGSLPAARAGAPYEITFAYRGGAGAIRWRINGEFPRGLRFDPRQGQLAGTPVERGVARFVLEATDQQQGRHERPFELIVLEPAGSGSRRFELSAAALVTLGVLVVWLRKLRLIHGLKRLIGQLETTHGSGLTSVKIPLGDGRDEIIQLPSGIADYRRRLSETQRSSSTWLVMLVLISGWFAWRLFAA